MPGDPRVPLGREGETRAAAYLHARGYRILARNERCDGVEIDLIAARGRTLAFVEVKTRRSRTAGAPEDAVDARKRARLVRGASAWLHAHRPRATRVRFDVIACEVDREEQWSIRHWPGAFDAGE